MKINLDTINVVDIESTCWGDKPPDDMVSEIIEIGICKVSTKAKTIIDKESIIVRPEKSTVSEYCATLTGITQEKVDHGISYFDACVQIAAKYQAGNRIWVSWGDYDRQMFTKRPEMYPFSDSHINLKHWFSLAHGLRKGMGLYGALKYLGMEPEGRHHSGIDDAFNTARIMIALLEGNWSKKSIS
jgi:inhibitor of KinA sporulation pathway (predicted exonuclease)